VLNYAKNKIHQIYFGKLKFLIIKNLFLILSFRRKKYCTKNRQQNFYSILNNKTFILIFNFRCEKITNTRMEIFYKPLIEFYSIQQFFLLLTCIGTMTESHRTKKF